MINGVVEIRDYRIEQSELLYKTLKVYNIIDNVSNRSIFSVHINHNRVIMHTLFSKESITLDINIDNINDIRKHIKHIKLEYKDDKFFVYINDIKVSVLNVSLYRNMYKMNSKRVGYYPTLLLFVQNSTFTRNNTIVIERR
jgi:hypothetical protein